MRFEDVKPQMRRAKVLLIGEAGSGKTHAALTFPNPAVIDAEGSVDWFADRFKFKAVATKSYSDVRDLIRSVREGKVPCETVVIDSLTTIYNGLINAASAQRDDLRPLEWGRIKRKFSSLLDELYHQLPMHVVCVGWISTEYAKGGTMVDGRKVAPNDLVAIGEKFDGDKKTTHAFDFVFKIVGNDGKKTKAVVLKSRSGKLKNGQTIDDFSWETIRPLLGEGERTYRGMTDEEQMARDAGGVAEDPPPPAGPAGNGPTKAQANKAAWEDCLRRWVALYEWEDATDADKRAEFKKAFEGKQLRDVLWAIEAEERDGPPNEADAARQAHPSAPPAAETATPGERASTGSESLLTGDVRAPGCLPSCKQWSHAPTCANRPMTESQKGMLFALHGELKHDDAARHSLYEAVVGVTSSRLLTRAMANACIDALKAEKEGAL